MATPHWHRPASLAGLALVAVSACSEAPTEALLQPASAQLSVAPVASAPDVVADDVLLAVDDVRERLLPRLADPDAATRLAAQLTDLRARLDAGDLAAAREVVAGARATVDPNGDESPAGLGDPADLAVIRLVLSNVASALGA